MNKRLLIVLFLSLGLLFPALVLAVKTSDVTGDGKVNSSDVKLVLTNWLSTLRNATDIDDNGKVNSQDLAYVIRDFGKALASPSPQASATSGPSPTFIPQTGEWTQHAHDAQHTSYTPQEVPAPWRWKWAWNGPNSSGGVSKITSSGRLPRGVQPVTGNGLVYIAAGTDGIFALNAVNGSQTWHNTNVGTINSTAAYDPATTSVFVISASGIIYKLNSTNGSVINQYSIGSSSSLSLPPALYQDTLFAGMGTTTVALSTSNLALRWSYSAGSAIQTPPAYSSTAKAVIIATQDLYVHAINHDPTASSANGTRRWRVKPTVRNQGATDTEYSYGWPVIAESHGLVLVKLRLDWDTLWNWSPWPTTNDAIRSNLSSQPDQQALFAINLSSGNIPFIVNVGHGGWGDGGDMPMGPQPVVKRFSTGEEVVYTVIRGDNRQYYDGRADSHYGEVSLDNGNVRWIQYGNYGWPTNSNHDMHPTDEQPQISMAGNQLLGGHWATSDGLTITNRSTNYGSFAQPILSSSLPHLVSSTVAEGCARATPYSSHYCNGTTAVNVPPSEWRAVPDNGFYLYWDAGKIYDSYWSNYANWTISNSLLLYRSSDGAIIAFESGNPLAQTSSEPQIAGTSTTSPQISSQTITAAYIFHNGQQVLIGSHFPHLGFFKIIVKKKDYARIFDQPDLPLGRNLLPKLKEGDVLTVTGENAWYQGDPVIYVTEPSQLTLTSR